MIHTLLTDSFDHDLDALRAAADVIRRGGVIAYPTETVYGLGADPFNPGAVQRVFDLKGRDAAKALILLVGADADLATVAVEVSEAARSLMKAFWPGPLTLVLRASPNLPGAILGGTDSVAVRRSSHPVARGLTHLVAGPITSTSANRSGRPPCRSAPEVAATFRTGLDLILDGGPSPGGRPSTILDVSRRAPALIRPGAIGRPDLETVLGQPILSPE